ncbi:PAS domain S-box protein [Zunongwangia sp. SCSIO 43204]|uniref:sensor histidine kinase n=1 Tax=Zunongwangia sp. SCSIO 43204 TaxID=2779359 RepID=UPI001CAA1273|nr:PAS domain S-box protein [Zunongwangia sp. SCSIO 43204]UAB83523.1 PAS domain S-box protein [Zunongwangia sp. SCSIO 43204]
MVNPPIPYNDSERSEEAIKYSSYSIENEDLNFLSSMAAEICNTDSALITLIGREKQYIQSSFGIELEVREFPREFAFCSHTINNTKKATVVPDARKDERFHDNPFVTGENPVIFYSGYPLINKEGLALGTICAIDGEPKELSEEQEKKLALLAKQIMNLLELKKQSEILTKTNKELSILNKRFQYITNSTNIGTFEFDINDRSIVFNDAWWKITGYSNEAGISLEDWQKLIHPQDFLELKEKFSKNYNSKDQFSHQYRIQHKNGKYIWLNLKAQFNFNSESDDPTHIYGIFLDITEQKNKESEILYRQKLLQLLYELSPIGISLNDFATGGFLEVNEKLIEPTGYTREEFLKLNYWDVTPKEYEPQEAQQIESMNSTGAYGPYEKEYIKKNGERYPVLLRGILVEDTDGNKKIWSFIEDISERKKDEAVKAERLERIQSLLHIKNDQNERLKNFAHIVSHNLRSHSGAIGMLIQLIQEENKVLNEQEAFKHLIQSSSNLETTIQDLNEIVEVNLSDAKDFQRIDIFPLIKKNVESVFPLAKENKVEILIDVAPETYMLGVRSYLESIFLNFITNGIKYSSPDRESFIKITAEIEENYTCVTFEDNGLGIDMQTYGDKLFKMYKTFHKHKDARGIGLFITKNQIETMNGTIEVSSEVNKGTIFKIKIPNKELKAPALVS